MKRLTRYTSQFSRLRCMIILLLSSLMVADACAESFADSFVNFFYNTNNQAERVKFPVKTPSTTVKGKKDWQTVALRDKNNIAILYSDSLDAITKRDNIIPVVLDLKNKSCQVFTFIPSGKDWLLSKFSSTQSTSFVDSDFMSFLRLFCSDKDFQKKRVIFPLKEVTIDAMGKEESSKLYMPQNWMHLDYFSVFSQFCWFRHGEKESPNRQILVYESGQKSVLYNFIRIRDNWFLIEMNRYKN